MKCVFLRNVIIFKISSLTLFSLWKNPILINQIATPRSSTGNCVPIYCVELFIFNACKQYFDIQSLLQDMIPTKVKLNNVKQIHVFYSENTSKVSNYFLMSVVRD